MKANEFMRKATADSIIYLDMDGVLADFFSEYAKMAGVTSGSYRDIPPAKVDPTLNKMVGTDFFARLPKFPTADALVKLAISFAGNYSICSSPLRGDFANSEKHKRVWIRENLNPQPETIRVTPNKQQFAMNGDAPNILIDDKGSNIKSWTDAGGIGIKYQADEDPLEKVKKALESIYCVVQGTCEVDYMVKEAWSNKYKKSINCSNPKGFSQKAHCDGKKKKTNESEEFDKCYDYAEQLYTRAKQKGLDAELVQVADYQGDITNADARWKEIPKKYWKHYVVKMGTTVLDPSASQFNPNAETKYPERTLNKMWGEQYIIKEQTNENFADGKVKGKSRPGRVKKAGASCKGSVTDLKAKAKKYSGEKGKMYQWCANMKGGKK